MNPDVPLTFEGRCHCGAIGFVFRASQSPDKWTVRACQCTFCRGHGARTVTDPKGSITFQISEPSMLKRYRFGTRSSDFLICRDCGVYVAAVITSSKGQFATLNINTIRVPLEVPQAVPVSYDQENAGQRLSRREQRWTPVVQQ